MSHNSTTELIERVCHYKRMLDDGERVVHAMKRLRALPLTIEILKETGIGRAMAKLRSDQQHGERAKAIVEAWKRLALAGTGKDAETDEAETYGVAAKVAGMPAGTERPLPTLTHEEIVKSVPSLRPPSHSPNNSGPVGPPSVNSFNSYDPAVFMRKRRGITHTGRRRMVQLVNGEVPRLFDLCIRTCVNNIDDIEETGDIPFEILKPMLEKSTAEQLGKIELKNPYLKADTEYLWEKHCRQFPQGSRDEDEDEDWRECYRRLTREQDERLKALTQRINESTKASLGPQRAAKRTAPITPREARKRQALSGIYSAREQTIPSAVDVSRARRQISDTGDDSSFQQLPLAAKNTSSVVTTSFSGGGGRKTKTGGAVSNQRGPLMVKALRMLKGQSSRFNQRR